MKIAIVILVALAALSSGCKNLCSTVCDEVCGRLPDLAKPLCEAGCKTGIVASCDAALAAATAKVEGVVGLTDAEAKDLADTAISGMKGMVSHIKMTHEGLGAKLKAIKASRGAPPPTK